MNNQPTQKTPSKLKLQLLLCVIWFKNLFTKKGRKTNYFSGALKNIRKTAIKKFSTKTQAKKELVEYVKSLQRGPKKSYWEIYQLCLRKGIEIDEEGNMYNRGLFGQLKESGVKVDWKTMKFIN